MLSADIVHCGMSADMRMDKSPMALKTTISGSIITPNIGMASMLLEMNLDCGSLPKEEESFLEALDKLAQR